MQRIIVLMLIPLTVVLFGACKKDKVPPIKPDTRGQYVGKWNFKTTTFSYDGYYDYGGPPGSSPVWISNTTTIVDQNDSTGSISLGPEKDLLILKYCATCSERIIDLDQNGQSTWLLTDSTFVDNVVNASPGYSSYYTTIKVDGKKL